MARSTGRLPPALENVPDLPYYLLMYLDAYKTLHACREEGFSNYQPIQLHEMEVYCRMFDIQDVASFVYIIQAMDSGVLDYLREQSESKEVKGGATRT